MIEKLVNTEQSIYDSNQNFIGTMPTLSSGAILGKINELIDAVNSIVSVQEKLIDSRFVVETKHTEPDGDDAIQEVIHETRPENVQKDTESRPENVQDPYAEQRRWIGKLCRFWDDDVFVTPNDWAFGILTSIDKGMQYQYCCNENCNFKHCEPVKPDDDIIYRGE